ncbi:DUF2442 domain-containing protein [uncultured Thiocystis sp.]|jgi:hypothetical protein|uniref:DUF2442 domain-containing protein n=1 Tax=uncultured Thiocystis sp. TaxID=1202134 RepID=UPI0025E29146|nr:DUF2442 domain-containing protein [uncultured Thiocystis sp.]
MPFLHTIAVEPRDNYRLYVTFNNGTKGEIDLSGELWGEVFEPLKDPAAFNTAHQHPELGTVAWANGADLAPEFLLELLHKQTKSAA